MPLKASVVGLKTVRARENNPIGRGKNAGVVWGGYDNQVDDTNPPRREAEVRRSRCFISNDDKSTLKNNV